MRLAISCVFRELYAYCQAKEMHALCQIKYQPMIGKCVFVHGLHARHAG